LAEKEKLQRKIAVYVGPDARTKRDTQGSRKKKKGGGKRERDTLV